MNSTRFHIHASAKNIEYIGWLQKLLSNQGYCNDKKIKLIKQIGKNNKIYYSIKIRTWSFSSWNYIYNEFYSSKIKIVPTYEFLITHLTPLALAIWIMDDGSKDGSGLRISTNCFKKEEILKLQKV
jgi:ubiquinol-cytochrome c reductase cytochrome b subunit